LIITLDTDSEDDETAELDYEEITFEDVIEIHDNEDLEIETDEESEADTKPMKNKQFSSMRTLLPSRTL